MMMKWTKEIPKTTNARKWFWFRWSAEHKPQIILVECGSVIGMFGDNGDIREWRGQWSDTSIEPPAE